MTHLCQPVIITGEKNSGKTNWLDLIVQRAEARGYAVGGFLSRGIWSNSQKIGYDLEDIHTGEKRPLARRTETPGAGELVAGSYVFDPLVFDWAGRSLRDERSADVLIVDEFGPLEMLGNGFEPAITWLVGHFSGILVISVRPALMDALLQRLHR